VPAKSASNDAGNGCEPNLSMQAMEYLGLPGSQEMAGRGTAKSQD